LSYRSEIRDSDIKKLEDKVASSNYKSYLRRVTLRKLRNFTDREVSFDFPVTALVGPNGGGKTTILGAAGLAYKGIAPSDFFAKSGKYDASMRNWAIEYELIDKSINPRLPVGRTASFPQLKWNRKAIDRPIHYFPLSRTVAATEKRELIKATGNSFIAKSETSLSSEVVAAVEKILAKDMQGCSRLTVDSSGKVTIFAIRDSDGREYSEFHFGAGEASVIRIVSEIERAPDGAIILIEEIENGLHPVAVRCMVEYLIDVALRKSCQVIFTTHSNEALAPLPSKAIWAAYGGEVIQGKLDIKALRTITGQIEARLAVFVEDSFSELMVATALRYHGDIDAESIKIHAMGGEGAAVKVNRHHNIDPTSRFPSVCIVDGDQAHQANDEQKIFALPGNSSPEAHVFDSVLARLDRVAARLTVSMQLPASQQERVKETVKRRSMTNRDRHVIFEQIGESLDFTAGMIVANAFLAIWAQEYPEQVQALVDKFGDLVPRK
jgi:predicted ATPase